MKYSLNRVAGKAETLGMYPVQSELRGILYVYNDGEYAIVTPDFVWRLTEQKLEEVVCELKELLDDVKDLRDMEVRA